ncbi:MAG TPA: glycosyl transferase [Alphaproteobacteria bacterium]|nr:glycosyl transferase [Alphaproteobacteria bacterium]
MMWLSAALASLACFLASLLGTRAALGFLERRAILDHPTERSSHARPMPRGGGLALMGVLLPAWLLIALLVPGADGGTVWPLAAALVLAAVSWRDDLAALPVSLRLLVHIAAIAVGMLAFRHTGPVFQGLFPLWLDRLAAGFLWLWFLNLFNFMDGIDGIAGSETACLGIGAAFVATLAGQGSALPLYGLTAAAAALGFLYWNWQPARIFMGDVGSVPLGYLLAWLLLELAGRGFWAAALLLPLYYLADASLTLLLRLLRGERIWRAHREHFYQRAVQGGLGHARVVTAVLLVNAVLLGLALWATTQAPWLPLALGALAVAGLLAYLGTRTGA